MPLRVPRPPIAAPDSAHHDRRFQTDPRGDTSGGAPRAGRGVRGTRSGLVLRRPGGELPDRRHRLMDLGFDSLWGWNSEPSSAGPRPDRASGDPDLRLPTLRGRRFSPWKLLTPALPPVSVAEARSLAPGRRTRSRCAWVDSRRRRRRPCCSRGWKGSASDEGTRSRLPLPTQAGLIALEEMQARLDELERARREPIAIVGMGCRLPGGASSPEAFWHLLRDGVDAVGDIPPTRWDVDAVLRSGPRGSG